jgi:hypothetical protein
MRRAISGRLKARVAACVLGCGLLGLSGAATAEQLDFQGTVWYKVARKAGIDPALLYALALAESSRQVGDDRYTPWPWVIRTPTGGYWFDSREAAERGLRAVLAKWPAKRVDVGAAQVNLGWHRRRFDSPERLLGLRYNLRVAAAILARTVGSTGDPVMGIGRYNEWLDRGRARTYGRRVWTYYRKLAFGHDAPADDYIVATEQRLGQMAGWLAER